jgi:hypothetical protein
MKKILYLVPLLLIVLVLVSGCENKKPITAETFQEVMEKREYKVLDYTESYSDAGVKKVLESADMENNFGIKYFEFNSEDEAKDFYEFHQDFLDNNNAVKKSQIKTEMNNYQKYTLTADDQLYVLSRIDNTLVTVDAPKRYKDDIKEVLKELGY